MAIKKVRVSDVSGAEIEKGKGAVVSIRVDGEPSLKVHKLDVLIDEVAELLEKSDLVAARGRPPKEES